MRSRAAEVMDNSVMCLNQDMNKQKEAESALYYSSKFKQHHVIMKCGLLRNSNTA
jgi:hypothetical protein